MMQQMCRVDAPDGSKMEAKPKLVDAEVWDAASARVRNHKITVGGAHTIGSLALVMGHGRCWEHVQKQRFPFAIVMEDDIDQMHPKLGEFLCTQAKAAKEKPVDWEYLQIQSKTLKDSEPLTMMKGAWGNTGMYAITRLAAARALSAIFPIHQDGTGQLDNPSGFLRSETRAFRSQPSGASQKGSYGDTDVQILSLLESSDGIQQIEDCSQLTAEGMLQPDLI